MSKLFASLTLAFSFMLVPTSAHCESLTLPTGLWEGINESGFIYKLLQINDDGQHYLFESPIGTAFRHIQRASFTSDDISCSNLRCEIIISKYDGLFTKHLILSPHIDSNFNVLESTSDQDNRLISSSTYQLVQQKHQSSVRDFMDTYQGTMHDLASMATHDIYGLWVGIIPKQKRPITTLH